MVKVVVNKCFGGFGISIEALKELVKRKAACVDATKPSKWYGGRDGWEKKWQEDFSRYSDIGDGMMACPYGFNIFKDGNLYSLSDRYQNSTRTDKDLIGVVEMLGAKAFGDCAKLEIVEVPADVQWEINDYDGMESIHELHRSW